MKDQISPRIILVIEDKTYDVFKDAIPTNLKPKKILYNDVEYVQTEGKINP